MGRQANMMGQNLAVSPGIRTGTGSGAPSSSSGAGESIGSAFDQVLAGSSNGSDAQQTQRADGKRSQAAQREVAQREVARSNRNASAERSRASAEAERSSNEIQDRSESRLDDEDDDVEDDVQPVGADVFALLGLTPAAPPPVAPGFAVVAAAAAAVAAHADLSADSGAAAPMGDDAEPALALTEEGLDASSTLASSTLGLTPQGSSIGTSLDGSASPDSLATASSELTPDVATDTAALQAAAVSAATANSAALDLATRVADGNGINVNAASSFATIAETLARSAASQDAAPRYSATLHQQVGSQAWARELGAQVVFMAKDDLQTASLKLSPEHLGPVEVRIAVKDGEATVTFGATHSDTRAALEQSLPRLREMLFSQGMNLTQADVSGGSARDPAPSSSGRSAAVHREFDSGPTADTEKRTQRSVGLLDLYA